MATDLKEKKELIIKCFLKLVGEVGINKVTLGDVAKKSGISKSGIYYYFASKEEIMLAALDLIVQRIIELITPEMERLTDPLEKLRKYLELSIRIFIDETLALDYFPKCSFEMWDEIERFIISSPALFKRLLELHQEDIAYKKVLLREIHRGSDISEETIARQALLIHAVTEGIFFSLKKMSCLNDIVKNDLVPLEKNIHCDLAELITYGVKLGHGRPA